MKIHYKFIAGLLCLGAMATVTSCDDDKVFDMGYPEASIISEIHFDYEGEMTLPVGQEVALHPKALPEDAAETGIIYKSSDESVAYIDESGTLHCVKKGIATVSAVPSIGFGATASLTVTVADHVVYAEGITLGVEGGMPEYMYEGESYTLTAQIAPADHTYNSLVWSSSNPETVTVDESGKITCVKPGTATIHAETVFPDKTGVSGEMAVTVCESVDVENLEIAPVTEAICISRPFDLDVTYTPAHGTRSSVKWESSDEKVAFVDRGHVTPLGFGTCVITATCKSGVTKSVMINVTPGWYIWDSQNSYSPWSAGSKATFTFDENGLLRVKMGEQKAGVWRGDILLTKSADNAVAFHFGEYPVLGIRCTIPPNGRNTFDMVDVNDVKGGNPQCNEGKYAAGNPITLSDGTKLIYLDFKARTKYSTTDYTRMKLFQLKVADIPEADVPADRTYTIYWIRTFRSVEEMQAFAEAEIAAGK